ncbi:glycoside hydrolase family 13 and glycosyltransferase family 5 protein [Rhodofomes roseus]|uniref:alpha-1,3-glucan synthase n=1 Tax=Rhodofomes roseus TaxID=34475 RepID=A0ABQ8KUF7_9APHY|nr:glycoside hydrolase family 13 and glycosyltransferase family 5 protein [Rhodofomes roseus]KAH9842609.1 glycoside hydrolase family 13 and glycosyltransferase family 5 protein [Rhodofomes roseus]
MWVRTAATALLSLLTLAHLGVASPYREDLADWNLNQNKTATDVLDYYYPKRDSYTSSPNNWRALPFYTILLDKFADGDPSNNDFFNSVYEWDWRETQLRAGGDLAGMVNRLDYLQGMGVRAIYISGTPWLNEIWAADSYSPLDFSVVDPHFGTLETWQNAIDEIHKRNMYIILDFTVGTMANLVGFKGYTNTSAPFSIEEYEAVWLDPNYAPWNFSRYVDFSFENEYNSSCQMPVFWGDDGAIVDVDWNGGCYASEFDQYGDMEAFGVHPDWQRQLSKFASVQDRLREWNPNVMAKLTKFSCMAITALDFDGIRIDKSTQMTVDGLVQWTSITRNCAAELGKNNFLIVGEVTGGDYFGALYYGRGRTPTERPGYNDAANMTESENQWFLREQGSEGLDGAAFQYSIYRGLTRFLGMDGDLEDAYDVSKDFVTAWDELFVDDDMLNPGNHNVDPRHLYGTSNFDVFRWPSLENGTERSVLATFITTLMMPGVPLLFYGEEQNFYLFDNTANNYLYGRQAMFSNTAWKRHGCYRLGSSQYYYLPMGRSLIGCKDDWNALDHFDPTADTRRLFAHYLHLRTKYDALQDGWDLTTLRNWTYSIERPGSNGTSTEMGLWSVSRGLLENYQPTAGNTTQKVWMFYTNQNATTSWEFGCTTDQYIKSPYQSGNTVRNLFYPYETVQLTDSGESYYNNSQAPWFGCFPSITLPPFGFKAYVLEADWVSPPPALTKFSPGHDARVPSNSSSIDITLEFNLEMSCSSITNSISLNMSTAGTGIIPTLDTGSANCGPVNGTPSDEVYGVSVSAFSWKATINNVPDGVLQITVNNPTTSDGTASTNATDHLLIRKGAPDNVVVWDNASYDAGALQYSDGQYTFTHKAYGADTFRMSTNFAQNWSAWQSWENTTTISAENFTSSDNWWEGEHIIVQYWSYLAQTSSMVVHSDVNYDKPRRVPQFLVRGPYNEWGYDLGLPYRMAQSDTDDDYWHIRIADSWPTYVQLNVFGFDNYFYGDVDGDGVMERLPPNTLSANYLNMSKPPHPYVAWDLVVDDESLTWWLEPIGESSVGAITFALLLAIPFATASFAVGVFIWSFYGIKYNKWGVKPQKDHSNYFPILGALGHKSSEKVSEMHTPLTEKMFGHKQTELIGWPELKDKRRKVLIATLEYELIDWKLKVKIGGLGVMSSLMGKAMTDVDLIWVIPKVGDIDYPQGDPAEPIEVIIFGEPYLIEVETHVLDNITYVILDSPVFRAQTKSDPYPARMDDLSSAIFYSTWNQAIAATVRRIPDIDIYHVNDYHGALAPLYLLPKVLPVCLSLHNAEFQGLWPLRTKEEMKEVCSAFNISKEHCTKYVQFGNTFNLLHAAASFISVHQKSIGVAGVSDKYGKRSWARYPALWTLKHVDSLPNPDPTDIAALDENPVNVRDIQIDENAEAQRPEHKRQAQEWAGIKQDPNAALFVFVGRWSKQKGVDLIADVMPSLLDKRPEIQLICVGPVIDLYGRFAAEKLARLMELYPDRVYSKPEFTALPPYLFSGADFALIPSRDEPFGLVAVEFGRKGALGVGSRLGGLGLMPGWWFPVESMSTEHMMSQLTKTIKMALKSTEEERAMLRARSAVQRFPVVEWRQRMEDFHRRSIGTSRRQAGHNAWRPSDAEDVQFNGHYAIAETEDWNPEHQAYPSQPDWDNRSVSDSPAMPSSPGSPGQWSQDTLTPGGDPHLVAPRFLGSESRRGSYRSDISVSDSDHGSVERGSRQDFGDFLERANRTIARDRKHMPDPFLDSSTPSRPFTMHSRVSSVESISSIVDEKQHSPLNKAIASFTDADGGVAQEFAQRLQGLNAHNSKHELSIEKFLTKSEEKFFDKVKHDKLSSAASVRSSRRDSIWGTPAPSSFDHSRPSSPSTRSFAGDGLATLDDYSAALINEDTAVMSGLQVAMSREIGGWPLYTIVIGVGQMLSATSFQISLLSGTSTQSNLDLYVIGGIFLAATAVWYPLFRLKPSVYVLSIPWIFFGIAFFLVGLPSLTSSLHWLHYDLASAGTWSYAVASAAGFLFFGLNFGEEAGAATEVWMMRACIVQGSQQVWVAALWYWGYQLDSVSAGYLMPWWVVLIVWPLAVISWLFAYLMLYGLPDYYRQAPPKVPHFLKTLFRRKIVIWFLISEILRDFWLSAPYGRNWSFLWNQSIPKWHILLLVIGFFVGVWAILMFGLTQLSKTHTWLLPIFAVGLGAPRWCQMLWGTSALGLFVPWAGNAGPYAAISLWLWLGVLDAVQGVGLGMILLQTLSRLHVCATLAAAQVVGATVTMIARALSPDGTGPGHVFPDFALWSFSEGLKASPLASWAFWIGLVCQIIIVCGYFWFYRKEQLARP